MAASLITAADTAVGLLGSPSGDLIFRVSRDGQTGEIRQVAGTRVTLGSRPTCTIPIRDADVRPIQCLILRGKGGAVVRNYCDRTRLNDAPFADAALRPGDRLQVGPLQFELLETVPAVRLPGTAAEQAVPPLSPPEWSEQHQQWEAALRDCLCQLADLRQQVTQLQQQRAMVPCPVTAAPSLTPDDGAASSGPVSSAGPTFQASDAGRDQTAPAESPPVETPSAERLPVPRLPERADDDSQSGPPWSVRDASPAPDPSDRSTVDNSPEHASPTHLIAEQQGVDPAQPSESFSERLTTIWKSDPLAEESDSQPPEAMAPSPMAPPPGDAASVPGSTADNDLVMACVERAEEPVAEAEILAASVAAEDEPMLPADPAEAVMAKSADDILAAAAVEEESEVTAAPVPASARWRVAVDSPDFDPSVDEYLTRLLERVGGSAPLERASAPLPSGPVPTPSSDSRLRSATLPETPVVQAPHPAVACEPAQVAAAAPAVEARQPERPQDRAPGAPVADLGVLRELANIAAEDDIQTFQKQMTFKRALLHFGFLAVSVPCLGVLLQAAVNDPRPASYLGAGMGCYVAAVAASQMVRLLLQCRGGARTASGERGAVDNGRATCGGGAPLRP